MLSVFVRILKTCERFRPAPPYHAIDSQQEGELFTASHHLKPIWLIILLEPGVLLEPDLGWEPFDLFNIFEAKLSVVSSAPAEDLVLDIVKDLLITFFITVSNIKKLLDLRCSLLSIGVRSRLISGGTWQLLLIVISFLTSILFVFVCFTLFSNRYGMESTGSYVDNIAQILSVDWCGSPLQLTPSLCSVFASFRF